MAAPKVRADYDQLKDAAGRFGGQAEAAQKSLQALQRELDVLQNGDWVGKGATAFYQEMGGQVLPTLKRLTAALATAQQTTLQINQVMAQAEADAARCLQATGAAAGALGAGLGAGVLAGPGGGSGAGGGSAGAGTASPQDIAAQFKTMLDTQAKIGQALGIGDALAVAFSKGAAAGLAGASPAVRNAIMQVLEEGSVERKLGAFSQGARDLVNKSPTLRGQVFKLEQEGYNFKTGAVADGYFTDRDTKTITIDQPLSNGETAAHIAHEVGHAINSQQPTIPVTPTMTRAEYVQKNVDNFMHNEGEAQFNATQIRAELKAGGGPDIGVPGSQTAAYQAVYDKFTAGTITRAQAVDQMATLMGNEAVSTPPYQPYRDYYRDAMANDWDTNIAPTRSTP